MPLLQTTKQPLEPIPPVSRDQIKALGKDAEVFYIPFSGEIFLNYESYFNRCYVYRKPIFMCENSGKTGLTFQQALESEEQCRNAKYAKFPKIWQKKALEMMHGSKMSLATLTDYVYEYFNENPSKDELVSFEIGGIACNGRIIQILPPGPDQEEESYDEVFFNGQPIPEGRSIDLYVVMLCTWSGRILSAEEGGGFQLRYVISKERMRRNKKVLSKANFKTFIKESTTREVWAGAPWIVKKDLCLKWKIAVTPPDSPLSAAASAQDKKRRGRRLKIDEPEEPQPITFPIPDEELPTRAPRPLIDDDGVPYPQDPGFVSDFAPIRPDDLHGALMVWDFMVTFGKQLKLYPMNFHDFLQSLSPSHPTSPLLAEVFGSLMHLACREFATKLSSGTASSRLLSPPASDDSEAAVAMHSDGSFEAKFAKYYHKLSEVETVCIDQWYRWYPGRWATDKKDKSRDQRLRAWEVALIGFLKDVDFSGRLEAQRWSILSALVCLEELSGEAKMEEVAPQNAEIADASKPSTENGGTVSEKIEATVNGTTEHESAELAGDVSMDSALPNGGEPSAGVANGAAGDVPMSSGQPLESADPNSSSAVEGVASKLRKRRPPEPAEQKPEPGMNGGGERRSSRKRQKISTYREDYDNDFGDDFGEYTEDVVPAPDGDAGDMDYKDDHSSCAPSPKGRGSTARASRTRGAGELEVATNGRAANALGSSVGNTPEPFPMTPTTSSGPGLPATAGSGGGGRRRGGGLGSGGQSARGAGASKGIQDHPVEVEILIKTASRGFLNISAIDRLSILHAIVEELGQSASLVKESVEASIDRIADIRKELKDMLKEFKDLESARSELEEKEKERLLAEKAAEEEAALAEAQKQKEEVYDADLLRNSTSLRLKKLREDTQRKREAERLKKAEQNRQRQEQREHKRAQEERRKQDEAERALTLRRAALEAELLFCIGTSRVSCIGRDRHSRRYWWLDHNLGTSHVVPPAGDKALSSPGAGAVVSNKAAAKAAEDSADADRSAAQDVVRYFETLEWGTGLLLVEEVQMVPGEEMLERGLATRWAAVDSPEKLETLLRWLDPRGIRESDLIQGIERIREPLEFGMRCRQQYLEGYPTPETDNDTKTSDGEAAAAGAAKAKSKTTTTTTARTLPHMLYVNDWFDL
ncbi:hypothetical protein DFJ73DRAFT_848983 [Zopfochytrium polystomum]|nr:hypothetical protein DFJ73DRAFT_848983 [Zopfochytrium polystomum]